MFNEIEIKAGVKLKNKFVVAPMTTWASNEDLTVSQEELEYYAARSKDAGMVITASAHVQPNGQSFQNQIYAGDDTYIPSLKRLADSLKRNGAKAILQIQHGGRLAIVEGDQLRSSSAVKASYIPGRFGMDTPTPQELTNAEIEDIIEAFHQATRRAIEAGYDGVEIHGAGTYLVQQFFSPHANRREDEWGGSVEKRMTFPLRIVESVLRAKREFACEEFITGYRFAPEERENPGITLDDAQQLINRLAETEIDYLHVSALDYKATSIRDENDTRLIAKLLVDTIDGRKILIGNGAITNLKDADNVLHTIGYDLVAVGRAILYDPAWIYKQQSGEQACEAVHLNNLDEQCIPHKMGKVLGTLQKLEIIR